MQKVLVDVCVNARSGLVVVERLFDTLGLVDAVL